MDIRLWIVCCYMATICFVDGTPGPLECSTACEKAGTLLTTQTVGKLDLSCPQNETIYVISTLYGRLDMTICPTNFAYSTTCSATTAPAKVEALCGGKETCSVNATNEVFGDPCPHTEKYLSICYLCTSPPVNLTALEEKVTTMMEKIANLTMAMESKCDNDTCTAVENCFADKASASCPAAADGKVSVTGAITALETPPIFNCLYSGFVAGTVPGTNVAPYTCDVNEASVVNAATGVFTAAKDGKYRLTFMAVAITKNKKSVYCHLVKTSSGTPSIIARSMAQTNIGSTAEKTTTTIDIIHELKVAETVHVVIVGSDGVKITGAKQNQATFTGEFIRS